MEYIYFLLPLALLLGLIGLLGFLWALKTGQYDDLDGDAWRAILDDDLDLDPNNPTPSKSPDNPQQPVDKAEKHS